jgi:hypothetical protein
MKFTLGTICGLILGFILAFGLSFAQLAPFDAPLQEQLNGDRQEQWLRMQRDVEALERAVQRDALRDPWKSPCP